MFRERLTGAIHNRLNVAGREAAHLAAVGIHRARDVAARGRATPHSSEPPKVGRHRKPTLQGLPAVIKSTAEEAFMGRAAQVWDMLNGHATVNSEPGLVNSAPDQAQYSSSDDATTNLPPQEPLTLPIEKTEE